MVVTHGSLQPARSRCALTIGNFDGVHRGHRHLIDRARAVADQRGLPLVAVTFDPHPMAVLRPEHAPPMLTDLDTRAALLAQAGVDAVFVIAFSREIAAWSPAEFVQRVLVDGLHAAAVVVGANFRFGAKAAGDVGALTALGQQHGFTAEGVALEGGPQVWSSTYVRTCLACGDVEGATEALGRPYALTGVVERGDQRGRHLGFPTANVPVGDQAVPTDGVYAGWLRRLDEPDAAPLPAAISVGTNPTFPGERHLRVEAYVLDRDDLELYGVPVEVSFVAHLREMRAFDGLEELMDAIRDDVTRTRETLGV